MHLLMRGRYTATAKRHCVMLLFLRRLRAWHDASDVGILVRILREVCLALSLALLLPLGLFALPL